MKKVIRSIVENDRTFNWRVDERLWPDSYIKIWIPERKQNPWIECDFKAPLSITPAVINRIITFFYDQHPDESTKEITIKTSLDEVDEAHSSHQD